MTILHVPAPKDWEFNTNIGWQSLVAPRTETATGSTLSHPQQQGQSQSCWGPSNTYWLHSCTLKHLHSKPCGSWAVMSVPPVHISCRECYISTGAVQRYSSQLRILLPACNVFCPRSVSLKRVFFKCPSMKRSDCLLPSVEAQFSECFLVCYSLILGLPTHGEAGVAGRDQDADCVISSSPRPLQLHWPEPHCGKGPNGMWLFL